MRLYHYCCSHSLEGIRRDGFLKPHRQVALGDVELVWLTDLDAPDRLALRLTSDLLDCDRLEHRIVVDVEAIHWPRYARQLPLELRRPLELATGARPMHWYVSEHPVPVAASSETDKARQDRNDE
jgi:hypothetical protein